MMFGAWRRIERSAAGKGQPHRLVHLHLVDARQHVFHRVLHRDDLAVRPVDEVQTGIQRRRLARTGRAGDQQDAVRQADQPLERLLVVREEAQFRQTQLQAFLVQNTHHDALAVIRRQAGHAQVNQSCRPPCVWMRPSCGMRCSAMDMFDWIFRRR